MLDDILDWLGKHPVIAITLFILGFLGGCSIVVHVGIVTGSTKLMPY
jgi:hypothetical protein